jgi:hypothetical protein
MSGEGLLEEKEAHDSANGKAARIAGVVSGVRKEGGLMC